MFSWIIFFEEDEGSSHELVVEDAIEVVITEVEVVGVLGGDCLLFLESRFHVVIRLIKLSSVFFYFFC